MDIQKSIKDNLSKSTPGESSEKSTGLAGQKLIKDIQDQMSSIKKSRALFEKQWLVNIAFLFGKHYFTIEKKPVSGLDERIYWELKNMERKKKTRRVSNYILPLFRSLLANMLMMKSTITVDATTNSERDRAAAKVSQEVGEDFWQNCNKHNPILCQNYSGMQLILKQLFSYVLAMGSGYLFPKFNPATRTKAFLDNRIIPDAEIGEVEAEVLHSFELFEDPMKRYFIRQRIMHVDQIEDEYGVSVPSEEVQMEDYASRLINMMEGSYDVKYEDSAKIYEKWEIPSKKHKHGRLIVMTKKQILWDKDLPSEYKGRLPFIKFEYLDLLLGIVPFSQGMVEQLISLQEEYNYTITRLAGYKKWMAGKVMIPRKSKISSKWDDEIGQLMFFNTGFGVPQYMNPPPPPAFLMEDIIRIRKDMEDVAARHDTSLGRVPGQAKSGKAINYLTELDNSQLSPQLISYEQKLSFFTEMVLEISEEKYPEGRLLSLTGDLYGQEVKSFKGSDIVGNRRIKISLGSSLPANKEARQEFILDLEQRNLIRKDKAKELLEFGDVEGIYHSLDETLAKEEHQIMIKGDHIIVVETYEDHTVHLKVHTDFMKTKDFFELPEETRAKFKQHVAEHQEHLRFEAEAAMAGTKEPARGGQPA